MTSIESKYGEVLYKYKNGNVETTIHADGTKINEWPDGEEMRVEYPSSADVKLTNQCNFGPDGANLCPFCHEQSNLNGEHGDLDKLFKIWSTQLPGTEMAIGGGNPLAHPDLRPFLVKLRDHGIIANVTVNIGHMKKFAPMIRDFQSNKLIHGLGISYRDPKHLKLLPEDIDYSNVVFHMILGIHSKDDCLEAIKWCNQRSITPKLLLLGYKTFGHGEAYYNPELAVELLRWKEFYLSELLNTETRIVLSFDNLGISQLDLKSKLDEETWNLLYQGDDSVSTFYMDAIKQEVAGTSTSKVRFNYDGSEDIRDLFAKVRIN